jgi:hypothetical protein
MYQDSRGAFFIYRVTVCVSFSAGMSAQAWTRIKWLLFKVTVDYDSSQLFRFLRECAR